MSGRKKICIIDGFSYIFRAFYAIRQTLSNSKGLPTNAIYGFLSMLRKVINDEQPDYLAIAVESEEPTVRHEAFVDYKANRDETPAELSEQIPYILKLIDAFNIASISMPKYEADDVIATLARHAEEAGIDTVIVSGDKDLLQLITPRVHMLDTMKNKLWDAAAVEERWGVSPERIADLLGLMGDSVDNIPGVPGVGEKTAKALLAQFGDMETLLARADEVQRKKVRENLQTYAEQARLSKSLVVLERDLPLHFDWSDLERQAPDKERLVDLYRELEFVTHLRDLTGEDGGGDEADREPARCITTRKELAAWAMRLGNASALGLYLAVDGRPLADGAIVGLAIAAEGETAYVPLAHEEAEEQLGLDETLQALVSLFGEGGPSLVCHDVKQAREFLHAAGRALRAECFDTMLAAYLLSASRTPYRVEDVALDLLSERIMSAEDVRGKGAKAIAFASLPVERAALHAVSVAEALLKLQPIMQARMAEIEVEELFGTVELPLASVLAEMEEAGVKVDAKLLEEIARRVGKDIARHLEMIYKLAEGEFKVDSPKQLAEVLFDRIGLTPVKKTKTGYSTDIEVLEHLALEHPLPAEVISYRKLAKLKSTYIDALPKLINPATKRIHTSFNQAVAATGRLSSNNPNLQNIPIRGFGRELRRAFIADPGNVLLSADYSQIELRVLAHLSGDEGLIDAFERDADIHTRTAAEIFGISPEKVNEEMRRRAKTVNFGIIYGLSAFGLARSLGIQVGDASRFIELYFARYKQVRAYLDGVVERAVKDGYVTTILRRRRYLPDLASANRNAKQAAERTAINTPIQGSAADIIKLAMLSIQRRLKSEDFAARMLLQVHDELLFEVPEAELSALESLVREEMEGAMQLTIPLKVEMGSGPSWYEAH